MGRKVCNVRGRLFVMRSSQDLNDRIRMPQQLVGTYSRKILPTLYTSKQLAVLAPPLDKPNWCMHVCVCSPKQLQFINPQLLLPLWPVLCLRACQSLQLHRAFLFYMSPQSIYCPIFVLEPSQMKVINFVCYAVRIFTINKKTKTQWKKDEEKQASCTLKNSCT